MNEIKKEIELIDIPKHNIPGFNYKLAHAALNEIKNKAPLKVNYNPEDIKPLDHNIYVQRIIAQTIQRLLIENFPNEPTLTEIWDELEIYYPKSIFPNRAYMAKALNVMKKRYWVKTRPSEEDFGARGHRVTPQFQRDNLLNANFKRLDYKRCKKCHILFKRPTRGSQELVELKIWKKAVYAGSDALDSCVSCSQKKSIKKPEIFITRRKKKMEWRKKRKEKRLAKSKSEAPVSESL
eukprot:CAMPEP_0117429190 /NCGR_PEP_ID=MMETSP0758-20121206/8761_1 /TAXON_ID=63605 /ORGANISM="Percolomonas cosmopolitus, Strain AE-1 (ATCC 50343)" /LENGTH=236 /DNA_ID=CAMNT_0005216025 /DNA_START=354 /DNA_END=1064 /DNA_ORIENTATION=+